MSVVPALKLTGPVCDSIHSNIHLQSPHVNRTQSLCDILGYIYLEISIKTVFSLHATVTAQEFVAWPLAVMLDR